MDKKAIRARLEALRDDLVALSEASEEARGAVDLDQTKVGRLSRMDALQQQAMDQAIEARRQTDLKRIEAALKRLDGDDYGYCLRCGEEIAAERLELDPATTLCTDCAAEAHP
ncbi:MAG: TraR/DksA family transcriptional regulator [Sphingomonadales bacterium]|nr:TraR/DksA family transcriptional regulator [Sphingomonadales bacterium]